jgi:RNA polymerase sigma-70 factor, ECF subfamily
MSSSVQAEVEADRERSVLEAVKAGQTHRFEELVAAYQNRLFGAMFVMLGDRQDAEDITQEAFTRAFLKLEAFQAKSSFFTWLHRIAFNLAIDMRRREKRARNIGKVSMEVASESLESSEASPSEESERSEAQQKIYDALAKIDPERRAVIALRDLQGMDYAEIADVLAIPIGTVRSRLHRARIELKEILAGYVNCDSSDSLSARKGERRT